jgi:tRNA G18 (ribose-2'-O)-methylase SpoU
VVEPVERANDPRISDYEHVGDPPWLRARGLFVAEGRLVVRRLLESERFPIHSILLTPAALHSFELRLQAMAPVYVAPAEVVDAITGFNFHRGCLALAARPPEDASARRFITSRVILALEGVGNPDNVGGLFRVASAFGADGILIDPTTADPFYRKAVRTSMAAVLDVPFERAIPWPQVLQEYRDEDFTVVALTPHTHAQPLADFARTAQVPLIVMVGAEGRGLSDAALAQADAAVRIPIVPPVDSLNVTVAAGVALAYLSEAIGMGR